MFDKYCMQITLTASSFTLVLKKAALYEESEEQRGFSVLACMASPAKLVPVETFAVPPVPSSRTCRSLVFYSVLLYNSNQSLFF